MPMNYSIVQEGIATPRMFLLVPRVCDHESGIPHVLPFSAFSQQSTSRNPEPGTERRVNDSLGSNRLIRPMLHRHSPVRERTFSLALLRDWLLEARQHSAFAFGASSSMCFACGVDGAVVKMVGGDRRRPSLESRSCKGGDHCGQKALTGP
jgi:hypothetical protein